MRKCDACGNEYIRTFQVSTAEGKTYTFDSFECAIHMLAPTCGSCGVKVIGHGFDRDGLVYCCHHCEKHAAHPV